MLTSKQRSFLRGLANPIRPTLQLGKEGLTDEFIRQFDEMIEPRELVKINVLESNGLDAKETAQDLATKTGSDVVQVIGHKITLYRASSLDRKIDLVHLKVNEAKAQETGKKKRPISFPKLGRTTGPNSRAMRQTGIKAQNANSTTYGKGASRIEDGPRAGDVVRGTASNWTESPTRSASPTRSNGPAKSGAPARSAGRSNTQKSRSK